MAIRGSLFWPYSACQGWKWVIVRLFVCALLGQSWCCFAAGRAQMQINEWSCWYVCGAVARRVKNLFVQGGPVCRRSAGKFIPIMHLFLGTNLPLSTLKKRFQWADAAERYWIISIKSVHILYLINPHLLYSNFVAGNKNKWVWIMLREVLVFLSVLCRQEKIYKNLLKRNW